MCGHDDVLPCRDSRLETQSHHCAPGWHRLSTSPSPKHQQSVLSKLANSKMKFQSMSCIGAGWHNFVFSDNPDNILPLLTLTISKKKSGQVLLLKVWAVDQRSSHLYFPPVPYSFTQSNAPKLWIFRWVIVPFCCERCSAKSLHAGAFSSFLAISGYSSVHFTTT